MKKNLIIFSIGLIILAGLILSQENLSENTTMTDENYSNLTIEENHSLIIKKIIPETFSVGDSQFSIQVENELNETLTNVFAIITGNGFSTYEIIPIDSLESFEKGYILVNGNFKKEGNISLTIKINSETFYENVSVAGGTSGNETQQEEEKKAILENLTKELNKIKENYDLLEQQINQKKEEKYDISQITIADLKRYIRNAQSGILVGDVQEAELNLNLANEEYNDAKGMVDNAKKIKISILTIIKDNAILFSAIAGSVLTFFALYELLKKKKESITSTIKEISKKKKTKETK